MRFEIIWLEFMLLAALWKHITFGALMPMIQINHGGDDYPEMQEEVRLEDFFWTGSGDGPPEYLKKVHTGISRGKEVIVKTETVVATVYVDGNNEVDIPICVDCYPGFGSDGTWNGFGGVGGGGFGGTELPKNYSATDRRFWLLTVMSGFHSQTDNLMLEEKLAKLYRLAFTREQTRHLGINAEQQMIDGSHRAESRPTSLETEITSSKDIASEVEGLNSVAQAINHPKSGPAQNPSSPPFNKNSELVSSSEESESIWQTSSESAHSTSSLDELTSGSYASATVQPWELIQSDGASQQQIRTPYERLQQLSYPSDRVRVVIHNISQIVEDDVQQAASVSSYDAAARDKIDDRPLANQTEIVYTVFVNGHPVLATTAANDMKLVSDREVSEVIGNQVFLKAEPYLREPQATPLAPATRGGSLGFLSSIQNNAALFIVSSIAILLLFLLLVALLFMSFKTKHDRAPNDVKRASSRSDLLADGQSQPASTGTTLDTGRSDGIQNISFEHENSGNRSSRPPRIHFPGPPKTNSRRGSISSSDNTSDSSVYCPINSPPFESQRVLDEKAATLFDNHTRRHRHNRQRQYDSAEGRDHEDAIYTSVLPEKKRRQENRKTKRRYLSENRVGSLETSPNQRYQPQSSAEEAVVDVKADCLAKYQNYEHVEAYNKDNNYHRNITHHLYQRQKNPGQRTGPKAEHHGTKAMNREFQRSLQPSERSSDSGSIGSFLSMASVKTFPKNDLPEPLNRVLEPVFVTYYDNAEEPMPPKKHSKRSGKLHPSIDPLDATTIATVEAFPIPRGPPKTDRRVSHSDNPDPGVVGPVVWERHKRGLSRDDLRNASTTSNVSPVRDPAAMRNHYEDLLEGAMQMYTRQDDLPTPLPTCNFSTNKNHITSQRGSSAGMLCSSTRPGNCDCRPATAQPDKTPNSNHSTQPPSPTSGAWSGSVTGSHSPLIRPMSAGPFHRPDPLNSYASDGSRLGSSRDELSAAPILRAIQTEFSKFKHET